MNSMLTSQHCFILKLSDSQILSLSLYLINWSIKPLSIHLYFWTVVWLLRFHHLRSLGLYCTPLLIRGLMWTWSFPRLNRSWFSYIIYYYILLVYKSFVCSCLECGLYFGATRSKSTYHLYGAPHYVLLLETPVCFSELSCQHLLLHLFIPGITPKFCGNCRLLEGEGHSNFLQSCLSQFVTTIIRRSILLNDLFDPA